MEINENLLEESKETEKTQSFGYSKKTEVIYSKK